MMKPILQGGKFYAGPPGVVQCLHDNESVILSFHSSKIYNAIALAMCCLLSVGCGYYVTVLKNDFTAIFDSSWLMTFISFAECAKSCNSSLRGLMVGKFVYVCAEALQISVDDCVRATSNNVLPVKVIKKLKGNAVIYILGSISVTLLNVLLSVWIKTESNVFLLLVDSLALLTNMLMLTFYTFFGDLYDYMTSFCYEKLKIVLMDSKTDEFEKKLHALLKFYKRVCQTCNYFNKMISYAVMFWILNTMIVMVVNSMLLVTMVVEQVDFFVFSVTAFRVYFTYVFVIAFNLRIEKLQTNNYLMMSFLYKYRACHFGTERVSQMELLLSTFCLYKPSLNILGIFVMGIKTIAINHRILSFLYKYPSSQLGPNGLSRIELLLTTLRLCKPTLSVFRVFDVGIKLFALSSGFVITYILVLVQFYLPWVRSEND
ncbi:hypothetical protein FQR65_LT00164 [Abscondita terminalis]|nr:hypothetical protein FQR65_LT00164 [Abscondita terminalis]